MKRKQTLNLEKLKAHLPPTYPPAHMNENRVAWQGVVLLILFQNRILLIKRSEEVPSHKGQLAFIGGHKIESETDPWETAFREFAEETGLNPDCLQPLGVFPATMTPRSGLFVPLVAHLDISLEELQQKVCSNGEWTMLLGVDLESLSVENEWKYGLRLAMGPDEALLFRALGPRDYIALGTSEGGPLPEAKALPYFLLWGMTARILWKFFNFYFEREKEWT